MMGPNCAFIAEELTRNLPITPDMCVLDLGCGKGITSIFLQKAFDAFVFAVDLWIGASENYATFSSFGLANNIIPIHADANDLPFANAYFDAIVSVDSYHYFGANDTFAHEKLLPLLKPNGILAIAIPGVKQDLQEFMPPEFPESWRTCFKTCGYWQNIFANCKNIQDLQVRELDCFDDAWQSWLECDNPYAEADREPWEMGAHKHLSLIAITARKNRLEL